jgi:hypothetical protein
MCAAPCEPHIRGMTPVTRRDRFVDLAALLIILAGIALYLDGTSRLHAITLFTREHRAPQGVKQLEVADRARYEANAGIAIAVLGCIVGAGSAARVVARDRRIKGPPARPLS